MAKLQLRRGPMWSGAIGPPGYVRKTGLLGDTMFDTGSTAFMLICTMLIFLMTPGLAFFYGGLARRKNVANTMLMTFVVIGVVGVCSGSSPAGLSRMAETDPSRFSAVLTSCFVCPLSSRFLSRP